MNNTVLILGARGRLGTALVQAFAERGWRVLAQCRPGRPPTAAPQDGVQWLAHDLGQTASLAQRAQGACVVVHAMNPSAYTHRAWHTEAPAMMQSAVALAQALGAHLMFPGNVYNYARELPTVLDANTPQQPDTPMGRIRVALEQQLRAANRQGLQATVIRAGNYFGAGQGSWLDLVMVRGLRQGRVTLPGPAAVPVAWAYLPDLAQAFVQVAEATPPLAGGWQELPFEGHTLSGQDWLDALTDLAWERGWLSPQARRAGALASRQLPWGVMRLLSPLVPTWASLVAQRHLWLKPHRLDGRALAQRVGPLAVTPFPVAVRRALDALGDASLRSVVPQSLSTPLHTQEA